MSDLISRQAAIEVADAIWTVTGDKNVAKVWQQIKDLPSAQPEPHEGRWADGRCNKCGGQAPFWVMASTYYESDFCPHCGAKMKGAQNG